MTYHFIEKGVKEDLLSFCKSVSPNNEIKAVMAYDSGIPEQKNIRREYQVNLIVDSSRTIFKFHKIIHRENKINLLKIDFNTFNRDVYNSWLGGMLSDNLLLPYEPLFNYNLLLEQEIKVKKRIINEILNNLVFEYPEMSHNLLIKPEYFMFESLARKASLYPPMLLRVLNVMEGQNSAEKKRIMMKGFSIAINDLVEKGTISFSDEFISITEEQIKNYKNSKLRIGLILRNMGNVLLNHPFEIFSKLMWTLVEDYLIYTKNFFRGDYNLGLNIPDLEDTKKHIFIPTSLGKISLSDRTTIEEFTRKKIIFGKQVIKTKRLGGVLNSVYIIMFEEEGVEKEIVVKIFKDWYGLKWFPLALWTIGTKQFAVLGKSRLEKEYSINRFLSKNGFYVPKILYISSKKKLIFQEYVKGINLATIIRDMGKSKIKNSHNDVILSKVGSEIAGIHKLRVSLGDCKPENIIITPDERIFFVDLEQGARNGDQAWDLAEILYFSGFQVSFAPKEVVEVVIKKIVGGYLESGGRIENVKKALSPKYMKVFTFLTPPHILYIISSSSKKVLKAAYNEG